MATHRGQGLLYERSFETRGPSKWKYNGELAQISFELKTSNWKHVNGVLARRSYRAHTYTHSLKPDNVATFTNALWALLVPERESMAGSLYTDIRVLRTNRLGTSHCRRSGTALWASLITNINIEFLPQHSNGRYQGKTPRSSPDVLFPPLRWRPTYFIFLD